MGQEQGKALSQSEAHNIGHSRRKNIFTNTPSQSDGASNHDSRLKNQERPYAQSMVSPVHQYKDQERSQAGSNRSQIIHKALQNLIGEQSYEQLPPADRYPSRITYFNAWSLPIQKYYLEEKGHFVADEEEEVETRQYREMKQVDEGQLKGLMADKMRQEINMNQNRNRRQNMNMM